MADPEFIPLGNGPWSRRPTSRSLKAFADEYRKEEIAREGRKGFDYFP